MSKYVKLEDTMEVHRQFAINGRLAKNVVERYEDLPTIDIVHCGECKHRNTANCPMAWFDEHSQEYKYGNSYDDFCSDGESEEK